MNETQSTDDSNCTGSESSPSPSSNASPHSDNSFEAPHTESHQTNNRSASHEPSDTENQSVRPVNGASEEAPDNQTDTEAESTLSNPNHASDFQSPIQTDQTDANQAADMSAESRQWGRSRLQELFNWSVSKKTKERS